MIQRYEEAVGELYRAAHDSFVSARKRLADELKAAGDKPGAAKLLKLPRPAISAWAVNQLYVHAAQDFERLFETAAELRQGKLSARAAHREALTKLSARARKLLAEGGHSANEATVRRVEMTLAGLAASGSFAPDPPGALSKDRDPPGFDAFGGAAFASGPNDSKPREPAHEKTPGSPQAQHVSAEQRRRAHAAAEEARNEAVAAQKREAEARAKREAERRELRAALLEATSELKKRESEHARLTKDLAAAERELEKSRAAVEKLEARLSAAAG